MRGHNRIFYFAYKCIFQEFFFTLGHLSFLKFFVENVYSTGLFVPVFYVNFFLRAQSK